MISFRNVSILFLCYTPTKDPLLLQRPWTREKFLTLKIPHNAFKQNISLENLMKYSASA